MSRARAGQDELDAAGALLAVDPEPDEEGDPDEEDEPDDEDEESDDPDEDDSDLAGLLVGEEPLSDPDERESVR